MSRRQESANSTQAPLLKQAIYYCYHCIPTLEWLKKDHRRYITRYSSFCTPLQSPSTHPECNNVAVTPQPHRPRASDYSPAQLNQYTTRACAGAPNIRGTAFPATDYRFSETQIPTAHHYKDPQWAPRQSRSTSRRDHRTHRRG